MSAKKILLFFVLPAVLIFAPLILLSSPSMGCYQSWIDDKPDTDTAKTWQLRLADINLATLRPELAAEMYGKFAERFPKDERRPEVLWMKAMAHEKADQQHEAIQTLLTLAREHKAHARGREADGRLNRQYKYFTR